MNILILLVVSLAVGGSGGYFLQMILSKRSQEGAMRKAQMIIEDAKLEAKDLLLNTKEKAVKALSEIKKEEQIRRRQLDKTEERVERMEQNVAQKEAELTNRFDGLKKKIKEVEKAREDISKIRQDELEKLKQITKLSPEKAKDLMLKSVETEYAEDIREQLKKFEQKNRETLDEKA